MKIVIAPDSYKGSLNALEVANAIEKGILKVDSSCEITKVPMADGGEGTVQSLVDATGGRIVEVGVYDPLFRKIKAFYGILGDGKTAVIEMAAASGLPLLSENEKNPLIASTYGTGELIKDAIKNGCKNIIIGLGGSATNDGGEGMARALGIKFLDKEGLEIGFGGGCLDRLNKIDISQLDFRLKDCSITVACDVNNPLCGFNGASFVFGPQKGADSDMIKKLDENLKHYGNIIKEQIGKDIIDYPGAGAAGGLGGAFLAFFNAKLEKGVDIVIKVTHIEDKIKDADIVITGEGMIDYQTAFGKTPFGVAMVASKYNIPVIAIAGGIGKNAETLYEKGFNSIFSIVNKPMSLQESIKNADKLIEETSERIFRILNINK